MSTSDLTVSFPSPGVIFLRSPSLFGDADAPACRSFLDRVFRAEEILGVTISGGDSRAELRYAHDRSTLESVVDRVASLLRQGEHDGRAGTNGHAGHNGHAVPHRDLNGHAHEAKGPVIPGAAMARDGKGVVRYHRLDAVVTGWEIKIDRPGRLKLKNPVLYRKNELCQAIERELMSVLGVDKYKTSSITLHGRRRLRPPAADASTRSSRSSTRPWPHAEHPDEARQARPAPAALHGVAAAGRGRPVRRARRSCRWPRRCSPTRRSRPSRRRATSSSRRSGSASTCSTRSSSSAAWGRWRSSRGPCSAGA